MPLTIECISAYIAFWAVLTSLIVINLGIAWKFRWRGIKISIPVSAIIIVIFAAVDFLSLCT